MYISRISKRMNRVRGRIGVRGSRRLTLLLFLTFIINSIIGVNSSKITTSKCIITVNNRIINSSKYITASSSLIINIAVL